MWQTFLSPNFSLSSIMKLSHQERSELRSKKPPSYATETLFLTTLIFFAKFYSLNCYAAITFVLILCPFMIYHVCCMIGAILAFITSLHVDSDTDDFQILSTLQITSLVQVLQHMLIYFSLYQLSGEMDHMFDLKKHTGMFDSIFMPACAL